MDSNLTWEKLRDEMVRWQAVMAPPWEMLRGEVRLQISEFAPFGALYVLDPRATALLDDEDRKKVLVCSRKTADAGLQALREVWPPVASLPIDKQEIELAAFYAWKAMQAKDGRPGMRF